MSENNGSWRLLELRKVTGTLKVVTGLRIGASQETMEIGGLDNPIMRNPADDMPYIPGSSIKGKMRSLTEWCLNEVPPGGDPVKADPKSRTGCVFGVSAKRDQEIGPTRIVVRDAFLTNAWKEEFKKGSQLTEVKHENSINRLTAMANPRPMERIVPGVEFDFELIYRVLDSGDGGARDRSNFDDVVLLGLALLQADFLGSAGSRGCGQIAFHELKDEHGKEIKLPAITDYTQAQAV